MNINVHGFRWVPNNRYVSIEDLFEHARRENGVKKYYFFYDRLYYIEEVDHYYVGLFLTIKDQRKFTAIAAAGQDFQITVETIGGGLEPPDDPEEEPVDKRIMDFNFFVFNKRTNRGVYSFYQQSCQIATFSSYFRRMYNELRDERLRQERHANAITREQAEVMGRETLDWSYIPRGMTYQELLANCTQITSFEYSFEMIDDQNQDKQKTPFGGLVQTKTEKVIFPKETPVALIERGIEQIVQTLTPFKGKARGRTEGGVAQEVDIVENFIGKLKSYDYHEEVENMAFSFDQFRNSALLGKMLACAREFDMII